MRCDQIGCFDLPATFSNMPMPSPTSTRHTVRSVSGNNEKKKKIAKPLHTAPLPPVYTWRSEPMNQTAPLSTMNISPMHRIWKTDGARRLGEITPTEG